MRARLLYAAGYVLLLLLPALQMWLPLVPSTPLHGVEQAPEALGPSLRSCFDGTLARRLEAHVRAHIGFRGKMVKLHNQVRYSILRRTGPVHGTQIVRGIDGWLFESVYIDHLLNPPAPDAESLGSLADELETLQAHLAQRGIAFCFVISPSKATVYADMLPRSLQARVPTARLTSEREHLVSELRARGVRVVDGTALAKAFRREGHLVFAPGSTHWSYHGSLLITRELIQSLNVETAPPMPLPELGALEEREAVGTDQDLAILLNLIWLPTTYARLPYPTLLTRPQPLHERPDMLMLGDSFSHTLVDSLHSAQSAGHIDLLYYHRRHFAYPAAADGARMLDPRSADQGAYQAKELDWDGLLAGKRIVIVEVNETLIGHGLWGFVTQLDQHLTSRDK